MAKLYLAEYDELPTTGTTNKPIEVPKEPALAEQTVAIGAEAKSNAFGSTTRYVWVSTDAICSFLFGSSPTATTSNKRIPADFVGFFGVTPGHKISVISNT